MNAITGPTNALVGDEMKKKQADILAGREGVAVNNQTLLDTYVQQKAGTGVEGFSDFTALGGPLQKDVLGNIYNAGGADVTKMFKAFNDIKDKQAQSQKNYEDYIKTAKETAGRDANIFTQGMKGIGG